MYDMPTISVRISEQEKKRLMSYGELSTSIREAVKLYLDSKKAQEHLRKLEELQRKNPIKTTSAEEVRLIKEDRTR
jgi:hypothetical protein